MASRISTMPIALMLTVISTDCLANSACLAAAPITSKVRRAHGRQCIVFETVKDLCGGFRAIIHDRDVRVVRVKNR